MRNGLTGIYYSRKATFCMIIFIVASIALFVGKLQGAYYSMVVASIITCWTASHSYQQVNGKPPITQPGGGND